MADIAQLTTISWNTTAIPRITSFNGPNMGTPIINVPDLNDTAVEKISSALFDGGQLSMSLNFEADDTTHNAMNDDCIAGTPRAIVLQFQNGTSATNEYSCTAFCTQFTPGGNVGEQLTAEVTLDVTGVVTIT